MVEFPALGSTAVVASHPKNLLDVAVKVVEEEVAAIDLVCSRFRPDSEIVGLNSSAGQWFETSPLLFEALRVGLAAARNSDGAVDPTIGHTLQLLGYDRDFSELDSSAERPPLVTRRVPGWRKVQLDPERLRARLPVGVEVDLGATAKALAADRAAGRVARVTGGGVLVSLGGDISLAGGPPPGGWLVRVCEDHRASTDAPGQDVTLSCGGLATSSTTVRTWLRGSERMHHIVDPETGLCANGMWRTVSVAAASCVDANTASTAALVKGSGAESWLERHGLPARLVALDGSVRSVCGWPEAGR